jgi:hypothetical protein
MLSLPTAPPGSRQRGPAPGPARATWRFADWSMWQSAKKLSLPTTRRQGSRQILRRRTPSTPAEICRLPNFADCWALPGQSAKNSLPTAFLSRLPGSGFADCLVWQSAKVFFADCPGFGSRQRLGQSAKPLFPVVLASSELGRCRLGGLAGIAAPAFLGQDLQIKWEK